MLSEEPCSKTFCQKSFLRQFQRALSADRNEVYSNCNEAMSMNGNIDGFYRIQLPNMQHNASIECKSVDGQPTAVLHHDMEQKVKFRGYEKAQSYR